MQQFMSVCEERDRLLTFTRAKSSARERIAEGNRHLVSITENLRSEFSKLQLEFSQMQVYYDERLRCSQNIIHEYNDAQLQ